jgi:hypothetical protein
MHVGIYILLFVWGLRALIWLLGQLDQFLTSYPAYALKARARVLIVRVIMVGGLVAIAYAFPFAGAAGFVPLVVLIGAPTLVLRCVIPLGWPRVTYWMATICRPLGFAIEPTAAGVVYGALALAHKRQSPAAIEWLGRKLDAVPSLDGGGVVASGLLADLRGDHHKTRCLLLVADTMPVHRISSSARRIARDWLVMDAARAGKWREIIRLGRDGKQILRWSYSIARIAERIVAHERAAARWRLVLFWILVPRRRLSLPLLRRALAAPPAPVVSIRSPAATLPQALGQFAGVLSNDQIFDRCALSLSVHAVNDALEASGTRRRLEERMAALGGRGDIDEILAGFRDRLADVIGALIETCPHFADAKPEEPAIADGIARVRRRLFRDIQAHCGDYREREKTKHLLAASAEWGLWALLRNSADRILVIDPASETALFEAMWPVCNNFVVLHHNAFKRTTFAYEIYSWLHSHSWSNPSARDLLAKNMRAALGPVRD